MKILNITTKVFLILIGLAFLNVAVQAFINSQTVMDFVSVELNNISARNSTRAFYGGVNLSFALFFIYGAFKMQKEALIIAALYGGGFVFGRIYNIIFEGQPISFIFMWLGIETFVTLLSLIILFQMKKQKVNTKIL